MLQQTQVKTVIPYFERFMERFPDVHTLSHADIDDVLAHWSGLGYYSRARNLHKTATIISNSFEGNFSRNIPELIKLPGIGPSTAAAITSLAFDLPTPILDGNVKRVLSRYFMIPGAIDSTNTIKALWGKAKACMPSTRCADYTQAIMDLGATCCTPRKPQCSHCPLQKTCNAKQQNVIEQYPEPKKKKSLPTKHEQFLVLHHQGTIYLEKRPPVGLWGGLWCVPTIDIETSPEEYISQHYGLVTTHCQPLTSLKHSFSHYHLSIKAVSMAIEPILACAEHSGQWVKESQLPMLGLPKPVSTLLRYFFSVQL